MSFRTVCARDTCAYDGEPTAGNFTVRWSVPFFHPWKLHCSLPCPCFLWRVCSYATLLTSLTIVRGTFLAVVAES
jgi:hypothetical protein